MKSNKTKKLAVALLVLLGLSVFFGKIDALPPPDEQVVAVFVGPLGSQEEHVDGCFVDRVTDHASDENGNLVFRVPVPKNSWRFFALGAEAKGNPDAGLVLPVGGSVTQDGWVIKEEIRHVLLVGGPAACRRWLAKGLVVFCSEHAEAVSGIRFG
ncbi:MAG: hypothetical protein LBJ38_02515 [Oscillospiraceae bacterium]|jgi:hypothetical protein|nr:hypothetical protein [Oscillospiraceae bacterium]